MTIQAFIDLKLKKKLLLSIRVNLSLKKAGPLGTEKQMAVKKKRKTAKKRPVPTNKKLYANVKAQAKRKFAVYPSAYANGWLVKTYKAKGGRYRMGSK
jgi:hypothetical protein|tara:strand:+ start:11911 stop:12204 length:294 start_codon:yes stop_codon:yes gene_type:complete